MIRGAIAATCVVVAGLFVANMLGVAAAEAPTATTTTPATTPPRAVSVEGVANVPIAQDANLEAADAAYRQAMADAIGDGLGKAESLAGKAGVTLGSVQSIVEDGGSIECMRKAEEAEGQGPFYASYEGERPDFGSAAVSTDRGIVAAPLAAAAPAVRSNRKKAKSKPMAKKASTVTCTLSAAVLLSYAIN
jgi:hypothetical protein